MIRCLDFDEVLRLHTFGIFRFGGSFGLRDAGLFESAVAQPQMSFGGSDLYADLVAKAAAIGFRSQLTTPPSMATNVLVMLQWKRSWYLTEGKLRLRLTSRKP